MPAVVMINVSDKVGRLFSSESQPIVSSVRGSVNCKRPVRDNGIFPVAKENINKGMTDTKPASQISGAAREGSSFGHIIGRSNVQMASARQVVRKTVSTNKPLTAFNEVDFLMYVYKPHVAAINK